MQKGRGQVSAPKSVTKIKRDGVEYTSNVEAADYYLFELSRAALRDVGRFVKRRWRDAYYAHFKRRTGAGGKATKIQVLSGKKTLYPRVEIGLPLSKKGTTVDGFYSYFQEFGSSKTPRLGLLQKAVQENIAEIVKIESQYLSGLSGEAEDLERLIDENDMEDDEA